LLEVTPQLSALHVSIGYVSFGIYRRSLDVESAATLVHAFVASCIDYCDALLANSPKATTDKLQQVLNAAARVVTGTKKFDQGLLRLIHTELHWLDVPE